MGVQKKEKVASANAAAAQVQAETEDEIEQIMSEIEELQEEMGNVQTGEAPAQVEEPNILDEFRGAGGEGSMEDSLGDLKADDEAASLIDQTLDETADEVEAAAETETESETETVTEDKGEPMAEKNPHEGEGTLTMTLQGSMTLKLKFECAGQEVSVGFSDDSLRVQLADGTEFKIPVKRKTPLKRVA